MRILFLVNTLDHGGAERVAALLASGWVESGHQVTMMPTFHGAAHDSAFVLDERVTIAPLADRLPKRANWLHKATALHHEIRMGRHDVVCSFLTNVNVLAVAAATGTATPVIASERTYPPLAPNPAAIKLARRALYPKASRVVMQTKQGLGWLSRTIPAARGVVVPNPLQLPLVSKPPQLPVDRTVSATRKILLAVGRLHPHKRFTWLVEQFARIANDFPGWDLVILGEGGERPLLESRIDSLGLAGRIVLPGMAGNLDDWYRRADAFALVSAFEGFPNALAEAVGYSIKVLAVDCPTGPSDLVNDGTNGVLLARNADGNDLGDGLRRLLAGSYETALEAKRIHRDHSSHAIAETWIDLFREVVAEKRA